MQPVIISELAIASAIGVGVDATIGSLRSSKSGLRPRAFEAGLDTWVGEISAADQIRLPPGFEAYDCRNNRVAELALVQGSFVRAVEEARARYGADRVGIFLGTSTSGIETSEIAYRSRDGAGRFTTDYHYAETHNTFSVARFIAERLQLSGPAVAISAACATTAKAFGNAARALEVGLCDAAIVGGADSLCATTLYGFRSLGLTSAGPCRPFDAARDGISIGEAAGFALIERPSARNGAEGVLLLGVGESSDAYHMSAPDPEGKGACLAMKRALAAAGLRPDEIDYINVHGTATPAGDAAEDCAVGEIFGTDTPCSSTKGFTGHTLGAAGVVEAILSCLAIRLDLMPGSPHTQRVDPQLRSRYLLASREAHLTHVLSNSFGFGGSNCSLVLGRRR